MTPYSSNSTVEWRLRECERATRASGLTEGCIVLNESPELRIRANAKILSSDTSEFILEITVHLSNAQGPDSAARAEKHAKLIMDLESMGYEVDNQDTGLIVGMLRVHYFSIDAEYKSLVFVMGMFFRSISSEDASMQGRLSCSS